MNINAVVFDMDGVIFDSERLVVDCWKETANKYGIKGVEEACKECLGLNRQASKEKWLLRYGADFPYDAYKQEMSDLYHKRAREGALCMKLGVVELLSFLKEGGVKVALASSTREQVVTWQLTQAGIIDYFEKIVCGDMVTNSKPHPEIFLKACEQLQVVPAETFAIEDSYNGIRAAYAANMKPIMVPDMAEPTAEMKELSEVILPSLLHVIEYMRGL
ncbi:MAG: HAD family phosphatase [Lachnospiraceae bacterium]|nr:HAD family phosphatase [Lachnospiraceae bacterium]